MDQTALRFILLVLGCLLVAGIYFWDKYARRMRHTDQFDQDTQSDEPNHVPPKPEIPFAVQPVQAKSAKLRDEPYIGDVDEGNPVAQPDPLIEVPTVQSDQLVPNLNDKIHFDIQPDLPKDAPRLIVQLYLVARAVPFDAVGICQAASQVGLQYDAVLQVYQRRSEVPDKPFFSMANMLEPGILPGGDDMAFATPGLTLFAELPGVKNGSAMYTDMLFVAQRLAELLQADLQDETHSALTRQAIEHTRDTILEHQRQIDLLRLHHAAP